MKTCFISLLLFLLSGTDTYAQEKININITDVGSHVAIELVTISNNNKWLATSDDKGHASFILPHGANKLSFTITGYAKLDTTINVPLNDTLKIELQPLSEALEEVVIVASTRNNQGIENSPLKVEVLGLEELNEEAGIKPGNIASILGDVSGVQIQQSSATSGNSNVRVQGLDGRYTQVLRDGMPLYDGFSGGFGILTIPPLDLKQIELIKGSASTLYGGGAIGGLVNLISKRPAFKQELDALVNYTSLKEFNTNVYAAKRNNKFGYNLFAGYTNQQAIDVNKDGLSDVPNVNSFIIHPKLFYYPTSKTILSVGYTGSFDDRKGGDMLVLQDKPDTLHQYYERNSTQRHTAEYLFEHYYTGNTKLTIKGNFSNFCRNTTGNTSHITGSQNGYYNEASAYIPIRKSDLVAGINITGNNYKTTAPDTALFKTFNNLTAGAFAQYSLHIKEHTIIEAGLRADVHQTYGVFVLPRIALFHRFNEYWASRAGFGMGYKTPDPLAQQTIDYAVTDILPLSNTVKPELSYGYNAEVNYKKEWNKNTSLFINQAFFLTQINNPILFVSNTYNKIDLVNAGSPLISKGFDTYIKLALRSWELYLGYTFTDARRTYLPTNTFVPLTPKNRWAFVVVKEFSDKWRLGLEGSYTGNQYRYDATLTPSYLFLAAMLQRNIGKHLALVLNGENLLDYRMSKVESIYTGSITNPVFKPLWAPIDGRVINFSVRFKL